jgi:hypothetical protein
MNHPAARRLVPALAVLALSAVTAACGGGGGSSATTGTTGPASSSTTTTGTDRFGAAFAAYRTCLAQHGVKLPTGGFGRPPSGTTGGTPPAGGGAPPSGQGFVPAGVDATTFQKAQQACASKRPSGGFGRGGGFGGGQISSSALTAFRGCLQSHGVKLGAQGDFRQAFTDAKGRKAFQTCRVLLPQRPTGTNGTTTGQ